MKPIVAALVGALIAGITMYGVSAGAPERDALTPESAFGQPLERQFAAPASTRSRTSPATVTPRAPSPAYVGDQAGGPDGADRRSGKNAAERTKTKTALIIGGSAASGAGVGAIVGGKKGALVGAAIGGGAASIYEATQRR